MAWPKKTNNSGWDGIQHVWDVQIAEKGIEQASDAPIHAAAEEAADGEYETNDHDFADQTVGRDYLGKFEYGAVTYERALKDWVANLLPMVGRDNNNEPLFNLPDMARRGLFDRTHVYDELPNVVVKAAHIISTPNTDRQGAASNPTGVSASSNAQAAASSSMPVSSDNPLGLSAPYGTSLSDSTAARLRPAKLPRDRTLGRDAMRDIQEKIRGKKAPEALDTDPNTFATEDSSIVVPHQDNAFMTQEKLVLTRLAGIAPQFERAPSSQDTFAAHAGPATKRTQHKISSRVAIEKEHACRAHDKAGQEIKRRIATERQQADAVETVIHSRGGSSEIASFHFSIAHDNVSNLPPLPFTTGPVWLNNSDDNTRVPVDEPSAKVGQKQIAKEIKANRVHSEPAVEESVDERQVCKKAGEPSNVAAGSTWECQSTHATNVQTRKPAAQASIDLSSREYVYVGTRSLDTHANFVTAYISSDSATNHGETAESRKLRHQQEHHARAKKLQENYARFDEALANRPPKSSSTKEAGQYGDMWSATPKAPSDAIANDGPANPAASSNEIVLYNGRSGTPATTVATGGIAHGRNRFQATPEMIQRRANLSAEERAMVLLLMTPDDAAEMRVAFEAADLKMQAGYYAGGDHDAAASHTLLGKGYEGRQQVVERGA
ncbi:hypothetical protein BJ878DRAFT_211642 [Calycina marina]|uniref:Uncharacterized protein n=1 Tax=Calycina marina TaxID=1763456 RepID=A0A9P7YXZ4_9HELO|nr:hypothetical protein BJ878DRAFT_211642 [Calycina marina]